MSDILKKAVAELSGKLSGGFDGSARFHLTGVGSIMADSSGVRIGDGDADVTLTADAETFRAIIAGEMNPTGAFMSGKLGVDGDMGLAMKLASALA